MAQAQEKSRRQCDALARVCRGRPDVNLQVLDDLSRQYRIARRENLKPRSAPMDADFRKTAPGLHLETPFSSSQRSDARKTLELVFSPSC